MAAPICIPPLPWDLRARKARLRADLPTAECWGVFGGDGYGGGGLSGVSAASRRPTESVPATLLLCHSEEGLRLHSVSLSRLPITQAECRGITVRVRNPTSRHQLAANMRQLPESTAEGEAPGGAERCEPDENSGGRARPRSLSRLQERGEELQARISRIAGALTRVSQEEDATRAQAAALLTELQDLLHSVAAIEIELEGGGETCGEKEGEAREASGEHSGARLEDLCGRIARARAQSRSLSSAMEQWVDLGEAGEPAEQRRHVAQELRDVAGRIEVAAAELAKRRGQKSGDRAHEESEALPQELQELPALDERGGADDASPAASTCSDQMSTPDNDLNFTQQMMAAEDQDLKPVADHNDAATTTHVFI
eukprot:gene30180-37700_t